MTTNRSFHDYVLGDVFKDIPDITSRAMFGGWGIYQDGLFFALIYNNELFFKVDETNQADFESIGSHQFVFTDKKGRSMSMGYWLVPEEVMEDRVKLREYINKSVLVAKQGKKKK